MRDDDYLRSMQYAQPMKPNPWDQDRATKDTARATKETRELIEQLVEHSIATANAAETRERQMLRWTQAGVALAAIAAVASIAAIVVTLVVGG